jgi:hypothetical protein
MSTLPIFHSGITPDWCYIEALEDTYAYIFEDHRHDYYIDRWIRFRKPNYEWRAFIKRPYSAGNLHLFLTFGGPSPSGQIPWEIGIFDITETWTASTLRWSNMPNLGGLITKVQLLENPYGNSTTYINVDVRHARSIAILVMNTNAMPDTYEPYAHFRAQWKYQPTIGVQWQP